MKTVWDKKNKRWVNIPARWLEDPGADELFALEKPTEEDAEASAPVDVPAKATTKGRKDA